MTLANNSPTTPPSTDSSHVPPVKQSTSSGSLRQRKHDVIKFFTLEAMTLAYCPSVCAKVHYTIKQICLVNTVLSAIRYNRVFSVLTCVPVGSPLRGGDVVVYVEDINQLSLPTPFYSFFLVLSTVFDSINSSNNSPLSHSVLPVLILPYWSFQLYISLSA